MLPPRPVIIELLQRYQRGYASPRDVEVLLGAFEGYILKYLNVLRGNFTGPTGENYLDDEGVQLLAVEFRHHGTMVKGLRWVANACLRFSHEELRSEIILNFLDCLRYRTWQRIFPLRLSRSLKQLMGFTLYESTFSELCDYDDMDLDGDEYATPELPADENLLDLCHDVGVSLTKRQQHMLELIHQGATPIEVSVILGVTRWAVYKMLERLKRRVVDARSSG